MKLQKRIIRVYRAHTGREQDRGALSWFARQARVRPYSVTRWLNGQRRFKGSALAVLENLEAQAGITAKRTKAIAL